MKKIKEFIWFARFCSFSQYIRDKQFKIYVLANIFNVMISLCLFVIWQQKWIGTISCLCMNFVARVLLAPFDNYSSENSSFQALNRYPLKLKEKIFIRDMIKIFQVSEYVYATILFIVLKHIHMGIPLIITLLFMINTWLFEEICYYIIYLFRGAKWIVLIYEGVWISVSAFSLFIKDIDKGNTVLSVLVLLIGIVVSLAITIMFEKFNKSICIHTNRKTHTIQSIPVSSKFLKKFATKSIMARSIALDLIILSKFRIWDLISSVGYLIVFSLISKDENMAYMMVQFFVVDYIFLVGFNFWGNNDTKDGMFIFGLIDKGIILRAFHISLMIVTSFVSTIATILLGYVQKITFKEFVLCFAANIFCIITTTLIASLLSIWHYYTEYTPKKYSTSNVIIMIVLVCVGSVITTMLLLGNIISAITLVFITLSSITEIFFLLVDITWLVNIFENALPNILKARLATYKN